MIQEAYEILLRFEFLLRFAERHRLISVGNAANTQSELIRLSRYACKGAWERRCSCGFAAPLLIQLHRFSRSCFVATRTDLFEFSGEEPLALNFEMPIESITYDITVLLGLLGRSNT